jgi:hypothetical protein
MYKFLSGAKAVKQYRGDENLPEAKKGMKNCGCKHPKKKYKYGTGALTIPEGSAIVTANGGKNMQALRAYKKGNYKLLNDIIDDMPEDKVSKADGGNKRLKSSSALGYVPPKQRKSGKYYGGVAAEQFEQLKKNNPWYDWSNFDPSKPGDVKKFQEEFNKISESLGSNARLSVDDKLGEQTATAKVDYTIDTPSKKETDVKTETETETGKKDDTFAGDKKKGNFLANIPSLAEIAARTSVLSRGIENVPENYLTLGRYRYESQLPKTLREIQLAEQRNAESARDVLGGDAGRYLSFRSNLSSEGMKNANDAVIQDTLARQDILNKNVDLGNVEFQTNRALKDQYAQQRAMGRAAYDAQLIGLGQRIDSATETARQMSNQRAVDDIKMNLLKSKDYYMDPQGNIRMGKNGLKKVKAYKRK